MEAPDLRAAGRWRPRPLAFATRPQLSWLVPLLLLMAVASLAVSLAMWGERQFTLPPVSLVRSPLVLAVGMAVALVYALVGAVLAARRTHNPIGWLLLAIGVGTCLLFPTTFLVADAHEVMRPPSDLTVFAAWLFSSVHLPFVAAASILIFLLFPDGQLMAARWGLARWYACGGAALVAGAAALSPDGLLWYPSLPNPLALPPEYEPLMRLVAGAGLLMMVAALFCATFCMVTRYRHAETVRRTQLRLVAFAVVIAAACATPFLVARYALHPSYDAGELLLAAMLLGGALVPLTVGIAIFHYGLFEIDLFVSRALVYVPLMGFLGGFYAASVALFQRIFVALTGNTSDAAIVFTTLIVASFFTPVRHGLETIVKRAYRPPARAPSGAAVTDLPMGHGPEVTPAELLERLSDLEQRIRRLEQP